MIKIGITGSIASGKTTASKILSIKEVLYLALIKCKKLYKIIILKIISKKFNIKKNLIKKLLKKKF